MLLKKYCSSILLFMLLLLAGAEAAVAIQPLPSAGHPTAATADAAIRRPRCRRELCSTLHREAQSEPDSLQNYLSMWSNTAKPNACDSVTTAAL